MQNARLFPLMNAKGAYGIAAAVVIIVSLIAGAFPFGDEKEAAALSVVYAKAEKPAEGRTALQTASTQKAVAAAAEYSEAAGQVEQIQLDEQMAAIALESTAAMQSDLARETAREENKIQLSQTDKEVLLRIVEAEATDEDMTGKVLVANVILNRVNDEEFPDTVEEVVFQKKGRRYQFSPIHDGRYYKVSISDTTREAVERVLYGEDESQGALYFMSRRQADARNVRWFDHSLTRLFEHGTHEFFK